MDDREAQRFISILDVCGLQQHVCELKYAHGHTLNVVITSNTCSNLSDLEVRDPGLCDHLCRMSRDHH